MFHSINISFYWVIIRVYVSAKNYQPFSGPTAKIQKGGVLLKCISGVKPQPLQVKRYIWCKTHRVPETYNLKFMKF